MEILQSIGYFKLVSHQNLSLLHNLFSTLDGTSLTVTIAEKGIGFVLKKLC